MSTRSRIGMQQADGTIRSVYCHSDGYPDEPYGVGYKLVTHYTDPKKIERLINLGDLSSLGAEIGRKHDFNNRDGDVVTAYGRDRGETNIKAAESANADDMYRLSCEGWEEYSYLFRDGDWYMTSVGGGAGPFLVSADDPEGTKPPNWEKVSDVLKPKIRRRTRAMTLT